MCGPPAKPGRSRGGFRRPRRPESCAPVPAQAGTSGRGEARHTGMFRTGCHRRRGRGSSGSPAPLRGREANARPRHAGLPGGPAGRHRAAGPGRAAQAQTEIWSATLTPQDMGLGFLGCNNTESNTAAHCSNTAVLSDNDFTLGSTDHAIGIIELAAEILQITSTGVFTDAETLVLVLGTTSLAFSAGITASDGAGRIWFSTGISWTAGTDVSVRLISLTAPGAPTGLAATATGPSQIDLAWTAPASTGGSAITGYKIEVSPNGTSGWTDQVANTQSNTTTTYTHTGLTAGDHPPLPRLRHQRRGHLRRLRQRRHHHRLPQHRARRARPRLPARAAGRAAVGGVAPHGHHADANGLTTPNYTYQWIRVATDNGLRRTSASANSSTYIAGGDADLGTTLKVRVSFTDDASHSETLTSAATATVSAARNAVATGAPTVTGMCAGHVRR